MQKTICFIIAGYLIAGSMLGDNRHPTYSIDLNKATRSELMQLPRMGYKTAERIIEYRKQYGPFYRIEELMNVKGVGEKTFGIFKPHIHVRTDINTNSNSR